MTPCTEFTLWISLLALVLGMLFGAALPEWCCKKARARRREEREQRAQEGGRG